MVSVSINLSALEAIENLEDGMDVALERVVDRGAEITLQEKLREIAKTDARPIPTVGQVRDARGQINAGKKVRTKGGKKNIGIADSSRSDNDNQLAWGRNGEWAAGQTIQEPSRFVREITTVGPAEEYEARLADLPVGALGVNRTNKASENARNTSEPLVKAAAEQEVRNVFDI